jgi:hypothetical protein
MSYDRYGFPLSSSHTRNGDGTYTDEYGHTHHCRLEPFDWNLFPKKVSSPDSKSYEGLAYAPVLFPVILVVAIPWCPPVSNYFYQVFSQIVGAIVTPDKVVPVLQFIASLLGFFIYVLPFISKWTAYLYSFLISYIWFICTQRGGIPVGWSWFIAVWAFAAGILLHLRMHRSSTQSGNGGRN